MADIIDIKSPLREFYDIRNEAVTAGLETAELAALMIEKFGEGMSKVLLDKGAAMRLADSYCEKIDRNYRQNRQLRYQSIAKLDLSEKRHQS